jgi:NAD(P) transhydrogenase subunit beta
VLHPRAARAFEPGVEPARQSLRHDRHDDRGGDDADHACAARLCLHGAICGITASFPLDTLTFIEILVAIAIGAAIGIVTARRIAMTAMPQLVAAFHSLVGLAAVLVAGRVPQSRARSASPTTGVIFLQSRIEMGLGVAIGAITFSGSVIAFLKLNGNMGGKPIMLPGRHVINLALLAGILGLIAYFTRTRAPGSSGR